MTSALTAFINDFKGKKVLIFGLGIQGGGLGLAKFFHQVGSIVRATDLKTEAELGVSTQEIKALSIELIAGEHRQADVDWADIIIRNPGVPHQHPLLIVAKKQGKLVTMGSVLFVKYARIFTVGITGTRGKSTTTQLIYELLATKNKDIILGGNIPHKPILPLLKQIKSTQTIAVLELSSWQLHAFHQEKISPNIAVVTNIYPDHLNRYSSLKDYIADKKAIVAYQKATDYAVINQKNSLASKFAQNINSRIYWFDAATFPSSWKLTLPGNHNRENAAAAYQVATILKVNKSAMQHIFKTFTGLPMRFQIIKQNKITIINDSTSTTPTSTIKAIKASKPPITLILGGQTKNLPVKELANLINLKVNQVVLLPGSGTDEIKPLIKKEKILIEVSTLSEAVKLALKSSLPPATLLFSPGFTSFNLFKNEFDRGEQFNHLIQKLA